MKRMYPLTLALALIASSCTKEQNDKPAAPAPDAPGEKAQEKDKAAAEKPAGRPQIPPTFIQPFQSCKDLTDSSGQTRKVCANNAISGAIEEGFHFTQIASCDVVRTQRPFQKLAAPQKPDPNDPRLQDAAFMQELNWVTEQVRATGCACCHDSSSAAGTSKWDVAEPYVWIAQLTNRGVALMAGELDATVLGAYEPKDNFNFDRSQTGVPTTNPSRMKAFFEQEFQRRGITASELKDMAPLGGSFVSQLRQKPGSCPSGVGINRQGLITWQGAPARYVYVLTEEAEAPIVPPNLDNPEGTLWRLNVPADGKPLAPGLSYGSVPAGTLQKIPASGPAPQLVEGTTYRLHVLADVGFSVANCFFQY